MGSLEKGKDGRVLRKKIAKLLRSGNVLSHKDILQMAHRVGFRSSTVVDLERTIEHSVLRLTGVRAQTADFGHGNRVIWDADVSDLRQTNMAEKLQSMLITDEGKPVRPWLRAKIVNFAIAHDLPDVAK